MANRLDEIVFELRDPTDVDAVELAAAATSEGHRRQPDAVPSAAPSLGELLEPPDRLLVGYAGHEPVACGAVRRLDPRTGEIKRMFVVAEQRGRGIGRRLLIALESEARDIGFNRVVLDTEGSRHEAVGLYESAGYRAIADYNGNRLADRWYEKLII